MSTKAIEKVLRDMQCDYAPCQPTNCRKHEAVAELEAIRKAAEEVRVWGIGPVRLPRIPLNGWEPSDDYRSECEKRRLEAYETLKAVAAKESP
jgi:hypothetical protein